LKRHSFKSIKTKLILLITLVISSISLFVFFYIPQSIEQQQIVSIELRVKALTQIASYSVATAIYFDDVDATKEQINALVLSENIEYIVIQTPKNKTYYQYNYPSAIKEKYLEKNVKSISENSNVYRTKKDIELNNSSLGILYLGYSLKELNNEIDSLQSKIAYVSLIIFIMSLIAVYYIGSYITKPISKMVEAVEKVRSGDLTKRAKVISNDEIGYLSKSFNSMIERIEDSNEEMETINKGLENRVIARTKELNASKEKAESAVKMKTEFLAQMSHEIRTPINSIMSYTQLLKEEAIDLVPEELRFSFDMINNGGRRLIRTVDLILNASELQTGTYEPIIEECNIVQILDQLVGEFQTAANSKELDMMFLNRLEQGELIISADIYTITQIFANLIDNAIKYTNNGSIEVVAYKNSANKLCVDVQDTGIGISEKFQEILFEAFTQEEQGYTRKFDGNGLGMALVKEYCKLNDAKILLISEKDKGSTFTVVFNNTDIKCKVYLNDSKSSELIIT
jgi:signal transduction histidine kinase